MDVIQANITCSRNIYGDWVSFNKTDTKTAADNMALREVRVFGSEYRVNKMDNPQIQVRVFGSKYGVNKIDYPKIT